MPRERFVGVCAVPPVEDLANQYGLTIDFVEPGQTARITYHCGDRATSIDVIAEAVTPLLARGHVMPGEE